MPPIMNRADWLLLFLSTRALDVEGPEQLDPIRIQKGMFLLSKRGPARDLYEFRPYNWGPFSAEIYSDLDILVDRGLVQSERVPGRSWRLYRTTEIGEERAQELARPLDRDHVSWLADSRHFVSSRSFDSLLHEIYRAYPEYAARSLLQ